MILIPKPALGTPLAESDPLAQGLVAEYLFNEGAGDTLGDSSRENNPGVITGPTWVGDGLRFNGTNQNVALGIWPGYSRITIIARVRFAQAVGDMEQIMVADSSPDRAFQFRREGAGKLQFVPFIGGGTGSLITGGTTLTTGKWFWVAATMDGSFVKIYVDGVLDATPVAGGDLDSASAEWSLGERTPANLEDFEGDLSFASVYNRALSASEINQLFIRQQNALHPSRADIAMWAGSQVAVAPSPGQVIFITKAEREAAIKAALPVMWACQGINDRRDFMKYTGLAVIGL